MNDASRGSGGRTRRILTRVLIAPIRLYQLTISPSRPATCGYIPTCSQYAIEALREHGPVRGLWLAIRRLGRCHPWHEAGWDPVPPSAATLRAEAASRATLAPATMDPSETDRPPAATLTAGSSAA